ncbi:MAG: histidine kinase, partial [Candidatus Aminicenantes bacterium]|nr:histidine kinase [Candidatus Aminicenantes bacterium]
EKIALLLAIAAAYFLSLPGPGRAVFMGAFNNLDGSLYAARAVSAMAGTAVFFAVAFHFFPSRLESRRVLFFIAASLAAVGIASLLEEGLDLAVKWLFNLPFGPDAFSDKQLANPAHDSLNPAILPRNAVAAAGGLVYGIGRDWLVKSRGARRLETEKMRAEIALLRNQINPHYFFNALNNIYAVAQRNGDEEAGRAILKLSETMRYVIYDGNEEIVQLSREVEHIRNTIDVFRLRFAPKEEPDIRLRTEGDLESIRVAPLLLVPFVENALKHGLDSEGRGKVEVDIRRDGPRLDIRVENTRRPAGDTVRKSPGLGLANVRKRLELLYPKRHALTVEETAGAFRVHLSLQLGGLSDDPMSRGR